MLLLKRLTKYYQVGNQKYLVLEGINAQFGPGHAYAIIGPSGSGKTTLLNLLSGLDTDYSGTIEVFGRNLRDINLDEYRRTTVGMVFQSFNLVPYLTVFENVALPLRIQGADARTVQSKVMQAIKEVGLVEHSMKTPNKLSGGQQQRVAIARALVLKPKILLADEPTGNLDEKTGKGVIDLILSVTRQYNTITLVVTHDEYVIRSIKNKYYLWEHKLHTKKPW